jgi:ElaA protein
MAIPITKHFNELTNKELYAMLKLRQEVFVVEQTCPYLDADGKDILCYHIIYLDENGNARATLRIALPGIIYNEPSIGRVTTHPSVRKTGLGKEIFKKAIEFCETAFGKRAIKIMAQSYLQKFYQSFGFVVTSEEFLEDDIPHVYMVKEY